MQLNQQNRFIRTILRVIDVLISFYAGGRTHWNQDPYQPADKTQWRLGWFLVMGVPIVMLIFVNNSSIGSFLDSTTNGQRSMVWLYIFLIGSVMACAICWLMIGPKVPLFISVPIAIVAWILCAWFLGFHPEK
jgi:hypothetical protein